MDEDGAAGMVVDDDGLFGEEELFNEVCPSVQMGTARPRAVTMQATWKHEAFLHAVPCFDAGRGRGGTR